MLKQKEKETKKKFYFWPGAILITEQQCDKTKKNEKCAQQRLRSGSVSVQSECHSDFFKIGLWVLGTPLIQISESLSTVFQ